jgi:hypothetical protein
MRLKPDWSERLPITPGVETSDAPNWRLPTAPNWRLPIAPNWRLPIAPDWRLPIAPKKVTSECAEIAASDDALKSDERYGCPSTIAPDWRLP